MSTVKTTTPENVADTTPAAKPAAKSAPSPAKKPHKAPKLKGKKDEKAVAKAKPSKKPRMSELRLMSVQQIRPLAKLHGVSTTGTKLDVLKRFATLCPESTRQSAKRIRTPASGIHPRQFEILRILAKAGGRLPRSVLVQKTSFGVCLGGSEGCGSPLGRYLGFPAAKKASKSKYPNTLLAKEMVRMAWRDDENLKQRLMVFLTAKGKKSLENLPKASATSHATSR